MTGYLYLAAAIGFEVLGTSLMKATDGFTRLWPTLACLAAYSVAFLTLSRSLRAGLAVGTAYAIWAGLGTALIVAIGTPCSSTSPSPPQRSSPSPSS